MHEVRRGHHWQRARVSAQRLICERGEGAACGACTTCNQTGRGVELDVLEFDCANQNHDDDIERLACALPYPPARARYKVVIVGGLRVLPPLRLARLLALLEAAPAHLKVSRGRQRYLAWLDVSDVSDISFGEWLKSGGGRHA